MIEKHYIIFDEYSTSYRVRPNPDTDCGFKGGAYLGWKDNTDPSTQYDKNEILISPDVLAEVGSILIEASKEVDQ